MTTFVSNTSPILWVAVDIAKTHHVVLLEFPDGRRRHFRIANSLEDFAQLSVLLSRDGYSCRIAFEPTGDYHRPLAYFLQIQGFSVLPGLFSSGGTHT